VPWSSTARFRKEYRIIRSLKPLLTPLLLAGPVLRAELDGILGGKRVGGFALKRGGPCTS